MVLRSVFFLSVALLTSFAARAQTLALNGIQLTGNPPTIAHKIDTHFPEYKGFKQSQTIQEYRELLKKNEALIKELKEQSEAETKKGENKFDKAKWQKQGGITDGGGNRVKDELFDFWIKKSTMDVDFSSLVLWNKEFVDVTNFLQDYSPPAKEFNYSGWLNEMLDVASKQKWVFDAKPIRNVNCWNLSPNMTDMQEITACNSVYEVRIYAPGFFQMNDRAQAGLIMHEILLSWARYNFGMRMSKYDIEAAVREINVAIFDQKNIKETVKKYFTQAQLLEAEEVERLNKIKYQIYIAGAYVCKNEPVPNADYLRSIAASPVVRNYLGKLVIPLMKVFATDESEDASFQKAIFCYETGHRKVEDFKFLTVACKRQIDMTLINVSDEYYQNQSPEFDKRARLMSYESAGKCSDQSMLKSEDMKIEIYLEALEYFMRTYSKFKVEHQAPFLAFPKG